MGGSLKPLKLSRRWSALTWHPEVCHYRTPGSLFMLLINEHSSRTAVAAILTMLPPIHHEPHICAAAIILYFGTARLAHKPLPCVAPPMSSHESYSAVPFTMYSSIGGIRLRQLHHCHDCRDIGCFELFTSPPSYERAYGISMSSQQLYNKYEY